ncbi:MAG: sulfite exporter TauE/SafE family protein [Clostridia bacterium]|nr:sulfite exporter TauE/SafE family protein [Clostridia bacterium]
MKGEDLKKGAYVFKIAGIGLAAGLCNGLFGAGGGMVVVPAMVHILKLDEHDAHATAIAVILPLVGISSYIYFKNGFLDFSTSWPVAAGGAVGGALGASLLNRIPSKWLHRIFGLFMIAAAVRMII